MDKYLSKPAVAEMLGVSTQTIGHMIRDGKLTAFKASPRHLVIPEASVQAYVESQPVVAGGVKNENNL